METADWLQLANAVRAGDQDAAAAIFERYLLRLLALARCHLSPAVASRIDLDRVLQSAMRTFVVRLRDGRLPVDDRLDLWRFLATSIVRKVRGQMEQPAGGADGTCGHPHDAFAREPTPAEAATVCEELTRIMAALTADQREIIELHLQGHTFAEIASRTGHAEQVGRRLVSRVKRMIEERALRPS
jgi:RNA polymerase sigma-70 factor (ECF subfamily)